MKENSYYKTPEGIVHKVLIYDDVNKMVCVQDENHSLHNKWVHDSDYHTWVECDVYGNAVVEPIDDEVEEIYDELKELSAEEEPIKKAKTKKKDAAHK